MIDFILVALATFIITFSISLTVRSFKRKNEQIEELKVIRDTFVSLQKSTKQELEEEQLRTKAITQLYDEKCEQYDELHAITVTNIFKPKDKKFLTLEVMNKATEQSLKVVNA